MNSEAEIVSRLIGDIYDAALDPALWPMVLQAACGFVPGAASGIFSKDSARRSGGINYAWGDDPRYTQLYFDKYVRSDPLTTAQFFFDVGDVVSLEDIMPYDEYRETVIFREWASPQGYADVITTVLEKSITAYAAFAVIRHESHGIADDEARRRMALLSPHFRRAILIGNTIDLRKTEVATLATAMDALAAGVFLVETSGRVVFANASGRIMIEESRILRAVNGTLTASEPAAEQALREALDAAAHGDAALGIKGLAVPLSTSPDERWLAHVLPLTSGARQQAGITFSAVAAVFVRKAALNTPSPVETTVKLYRLTPRELQVLQAVVDVGGVREVAATLGISEATVKTHLQHLFAKTGTRSQIDLVKLVAWAATPFVE